MLSYHQDTATHQFFAVFYAAVNGQIRAGRLIFKINELTTPPHAESKMIEREISVTDEKIDEIVYGLYEIEDEESKLIGGKGNCMREAMDRSPDLTLQRVVDALRILANTAVTEKQQLSINQFLSKGMSSDQIIDALQRAYTKEGIEDPWRYVCAICWRIITRTDRGSEGESVSSFGKFPWS